MRGSAWLLIVLTCLSAQADVPLRVVTYNTYQGVANASADRAAMGALLTSLDLDGPGPNTSLTPDVVCLQETASQAELNAFRDDYLPGYQVIWGSITDGFNSNGFFLRGDLAILAYHQLGTPGPRRVLRVVLGVPGAATPLVIYNAHFKAGQTDDDRATRAAEANAIANRVAIDVGSGIDTNSDNVPDTFPTHYLFVGDLNHDDFAGTVIDPLLVGGSNGLSTGLNDMRYETIAGAGSVPFWIGDTWSTRSGLDRRYDYILVSDALKTQFDTSGDGSLSQDEVNAAGFVYNSFDNGGLFASGQLNATNVASDHAPVALDLTLPEPPATPGDVDGDGDVDLTDLSLLLAAFGATSGAPEYNPGADLNRDGVVDLADLALLLANFGG